jgi:hypothetical protein
MSPAVFLKNCGVVPRQAAPEPFAFSIELMEASMDIIGEITDQHECSMCGAPRSLTGSTLCPSCWLVTTEPDEPPETGDECAHCGETCRLGMRYGLCPSCWIATRAGGL